MRESSIDIPPGRKHRRLPSADAVHTQELPDNAIFHPEAAAGFCDAYSSIAGHKAVATDRIQKPLAFCSLNCFGGQARGQSRELIPRVFETDLSGFVRVNKSRVRFDVVSDHCEWRFMIKP